MTSKEKNAYTEWNKKMSAAGEERDKLFEEMQTLYEESGCGRASCSLENNFLRLLGTEKAGRALALYSRYYEASGRYDALLYLAQAFADAK